MNIETTVDVSLLKSVLVVEISVVDVMDSDEDDDENDVDIVDGSVLDEKLVVGCKSVVEDTSVDISVVKSVKIVPSVLVESSEIVVDTTDAVCSVCSVLISGDVDEISTEDNVLSIFITVSVDIVVLGDVSVCDENVVCSVIVEDELEEIVVIVFVSSVEDVSLDVTSVVNMSVVEDISVVDSKVVVDLSGSLVDPPLENIILASAISACLFFRLIEDLVVSAIVGTRVVVSMTSTGMVVSFSLFMESVVISVSWSAFVIISTSVIVIFSLSNCVYGNVVTYLNINKRKKQS